MDTHRRLEQMIAYRSRYGEFNDEKLRKTIEELREIVRSDAGTSVRDFVPIRLVTIVEVQVKDWIIILIDSINSDIRRRAGEIKKHIKFDYTLSSALVSQDLTLGGIIAHEVSLHSIEPIISIFSTLLGLDFKVKLKESKRRVDNGQDFYLETIVGNVDELVASLKDLFQVRHVLTHEMPSISPYKVQDLELFIDSVELFVEALDSALQSVVWYGDANNVAELNKLLDDQIDEWNKQIGAVLNGLQRHPNTDMHLLEAAQTAWLVFSRAEAEFVRKYHDGWWADIAYKLTITDLQETRWANLKIQPQYLMG